MSDRICIPYFSGSGHTAKLAEQIGVGAESARLIDVSQITDADWAALDAAAAIVFGSPTYMGSTAAQFDLFLEGAADRWPALTWRDKIAAGFTVATHGSGDKLIALQRISIYAAQMGMIWVGQTSLGAPVNPDQPGINRDGSWLGLMASSSRDRSELITPGDCETAQLFGARIRDIADRLHPAA